MASNPNLYGDGTTSDDAIRTGGTTSKGEQRKMSNEVPVLDPLVPRYWREIERYERATADWYDEGDQIVSVFLDESRTPTSSVRKFALLWANIETLKPAVYVKIPNLQCSRRFKDKDPIAKVVSELIERSTNTTFDLGKVDETFKMVRDDRLLPGRGQAWVRYEADIEEYEDENDGENGLSGDEADEKPMRQKLKAERAVVDHVAWKDFGHNVARTWTGEVWLCWRAVYKTKDEVEDRFGKEKANGLNYTQRAPAQGSGSSKDDPDDKAKIYELWDKKRGKVSWLSKGCTEFLETGKPPINFRDFFPCPEACYATKTSKQLIPVPDYRYYRDQAMEINDLTAKIHNLTEWLVVKGFIPNGPSSVADPIEEALRDRSNSELFVPVDSWKEWTERGGSAKMIDWLPIEAIVKALQAAIQARNQLIQDVFQITGIADILRGQSDPNETLGAQQLKAQTGTRRLKNTKDEVARFTCDIGRLVAEVIAEKFEPQSIAAITGYQYIPGDGQQQMLGAPSPQLMLPPPQPQPGMPMQPSMGGPPGPQMSGAQAAPPAIPDANQMQSMLPQVPMLGQVSMLQAMAGPALGPNGGTVAEDANDGDPELIFDDRHMKLLRDDKMRNFRVDIETDSTVQADEQQEKQSRVEFVEAVGGYLDKATSILEKAPSLGPVVGEILMFLARGFRAGRSLEEALESGFKKLQAQLQSQQGQPNPKMLEVQAKAQAKQQELAQNAQARSQELAQESQGRQQEIAAETQANLQETAINAHVKQQEHQADVQHAAQKQHVDAVLEVRKQNLDHSAKMRDIHLTAKAQAQDRLAKAMSSQRPSGKSVH